MIDSRIFETEVRKDEKIKEVRSFVLRTKALNKSQENIIENYYEEYGLCFNKEVMDYSDVFGNNNPVVIEIGFGNGQATYEIARENPNINFIGIEVYMQGYLQLLERIGSSKLSNIKLMRFDAVAVLDYMISNNSIQGFHIFFPDPWQKKKHHKRRLIQTPLVEKLVSKLSKNGWIYIATDWQDYSDQIDKVLSENKDITLIDKPNTINRNMTHFERKGLDKKHNITEFWAIKN